MTDKKRDELDDFNEKLQNKLEQAEEEECYPEGGKGWLVVFGCAVLAFVTLGVLSWGVFQQYYKANLFPDSSEATLSIIGSLSGCVSITHTLILLGPSLSSPEPFLIAGSFFAVLGMFTAAWSHTIWQFALTQGVLQGIACGCIYPMVTAIPAQYFKRKRGLAIGLVMAGSTLGGGVASIIVRTLLTKVGLRKTLLIYSGVHSLVCACSLLIIREREMPGRAHLKTQKMSWYDKELFHDKVFWGVVGGLFFSVFGYLPPVFYLVTYTKAILPQLEASLTVLPVTLLGVSATIGRIAVGFTADKIGPTNAFILSVTLSGLAQLILWNLAKTYATVLAFSVLTGAFGGCFVSLTGPVAAHVFGAERLAGLSGLLTISNTPGNIAAAPLAGVIFSASGGNWHALIAYSGTVQILAGFCMLYGEWSA
ncbi:MFS general substrate transporter [Auricularia subglabra TFB-10046 SS5]|nr:MFS general substrate transporter [Auricularia subglabra TFB-10046 SS5]